MHQQAEDGNTKKLQLGEGGAKLAMFTVLQFVSSRLGFRSFLTQNLPTLDTPKDAKRTVS